MLFNIEYLQNVEKVAVGEKTVYHQTFNPDSAMRSFNLSSNYCGIRSLEIQKEIWKKKTKKIERAWEYHYYRFNRTIIDGLVRSNLIGDNKSVFNNCVYNIRKNIWIALSNEKKPKKILSWILYCLMPLKMAKRSAKKFKRTVEKIKES